jgi:excisionase family DNA binding protein
MPRNHEGTLKVPEVAEKLRCGKATVHELIRAGKLRSFRVGRLIRVSPEALEDFIRARPPETKSNAV